MQSITHHNTNIEGADLNRHRRAWSGSQGINSSMIVMTRRLSDYPITRQQAHESHLYLGMFIMILLDDIMFGPFQEMSSAGHAE